MSSTSLPKILLAIGIGCVVLAGLLYFFPGLFNRFGRLPGDIRIEREGFSLSIPWVSCLLVSLFLSLLAWLYRALH